jgi:hypothetical protein
MTLADLLHVLESGGAPAVIAVVLWKIVGAIRDAARGAEEGTKEIRALLAEWRRHNERQDKLAVQQLAELEKQTGHLRSLDDSPPPVLNGAGPH